MRSSDEIESCGGWPNLPPDNIGCPALLAFFARGRGFSQRARSRLVVSDQVSAEPQRACGKGRGAWVSAGLAMDMTADPVYYRGHLRGCSALPPATLEIRSGLNC